MREHPDWGDIAYFVGALGGLLIAAWRLLLPVTYPAGDIRGQPWFNPLTSGVIVLLSCILLVAGILRLRSKRGD